jgi:hypothetical protein
MNEGCDAKREIGIVFDSYLYIAAFITTLKTQRL